MYAGSSDLQLLSAAAARLGWPAARQGFEASGSGSSSSHCFSSSASVHGAKPTISPTKLSAPAASPPAAPSPPPSSSSSSPDGGGGGRSDATATTAPAPPTSTHISYGARKVTRLLRSEQSAALEGVINIRNTFNNIILTLCDKSGNVKAWTSAATVGFRNARKSQPVAAEKAAEELARKALKAGYGSVAVKLNGTGGNKQYAVQSLHATGLRITQLMDVTPIPYNGCRPPAKRRL